MRRVVVGVLVAVGLAAGAVVWLYLRPAKEATREMPLWPETETAAPAARPAMPDSGEWNTYHGDALLRGVAAAELPDTLEVRWRFKAGVPVRQTPVVHQGLIYAVTARGELICMDFSGTALWRRELLTGKIANGEPVRYRIESPIAAFAGMLYAGTDDGVLFATDAATGEARWQAQIGGVILGTPNYLPPREPGAPGRVYLMEQSEGVLVCLSAADGKEQWRAEAIARSDGSPSVSPEAVAFGSCAGALHVLSPETGAKMHDLAIDEDSQIAGGVAQADGLAWAGCRSGKVVQADLRAGAFSWTAQAGDMEVFATPAVTDTWVITASYDGLVYGVKRATGEIAWRFDTGGLPVSPVIAGARVVIAADGDLFLLRLEDGAKLWSMHLSDMLTSAAVTERHVLVGSEDGTVIALGAPEKPEP